MSAAAGSTSRFRNQGGLRYHGGAVGYALLAYVGGFSLLFVDSWLGNGLGILLLAHGMVIAAYMVHECAHNIVFVQNEANARLGRFLTWICGASYGTYEDIRYKHFRHHIDVDDVVWFDYERFFREHPALLRVIRVLEWFYVPAHDLLMHAIMIFTSFVIPKRRAQRKRNVAVILVRGTLFAALAILAPKAALLYATAYLLMITVLRFMDSLQHDYGYHVSLFSKQPGPRKGDLVFEQEHTFSNPLSLRFTRVNWLTLNFGFHNAHHAEPSTPWWQLPALHAERTGNDPKRVIPFWSQLVIFHRYRVERIAAGSAEGIDEGAGGDTEPEAEAGTGGEGVPWGAAFLEAARNGRAMGGNAASFLTSF